MSCAGSVLNMAPSGKKFKKIDMPGLAKAAGCAYVALVSTARYKTISKCFEKAVLIAREIGPTYIQIHTPCPTNLKMKSFEGPKMAKERLKTDYAFMEHISPEAEKYLLTLDSGKAEEENTQ